MAKKAKSKATKKAKAPTVSQRERFIAFAKKHGAVEDVLDRALSDVKKAKKKKA